MSNGQVGTVYQQIINEVLEYSKTDFDDQGIEESVMDDLRKGWQHKLSSLQIADFPWDPKPEPQPVQPPAAQQAAQQAAAQQQQQPPPQQGAPATQFTQAPLAPQAPAFPAAVANGSPMIKTEPGTVQIKQEPSAQQSDPRIKQETGVLPGITGDVGARVIENLQKQYGDRAAASISQIQIIGQTGLTQAPAQAAQQASPQAQAHAQGLAQRPGAPQQPNQQQFHPNVQPRTQQQPQQMRAAHLQQQNIARHQGDAAVDEDDDLSSDGVVTKNGVPIGRVEVDRFLHSQITAAGRSMEGGGLMVSLKEAPKGTMEAMKAELGMGGQKRATPPQLDGSAMDDDEAINSDLDDSSDNADSDDEDDEGGNVMLCVYDKVQRVKNKWKCTLKDGVLTANGREYVFHKAQGEFEW